MRAPGPKTLVRVGAVGAALTTALCGFTPVLVVLLAAVGLSALTGYLDYVLIPALVGFICLTLYAVWRQRCAIAKKHNGV